MSLVEPEFAASQRDPRLAAQLADLATGATPAWLWSADGSQILWANAVGAAIFGAANTSQAVGRRITLHHPAAGEIARLAASLPPSGQARLERLRGFGASFGGALTCVCSRVALAEGAAVLVAATERAGPQLPLSERIGRLFAGRDSMLAAFTADGILLYATEAARTRLAGASTLPALGIAEMAAKALSAGSASGTTTFGPVTVDRLGSDASAVLVAEFGVQPNQVRTAETAAEKTAPAGSLPAPPVANTPVPRAASGRGHDEPERRHPLRFVWQMDDDGRFAVGSDEFVELMGPRTTAAFGRLWSEIAAELKLDPENQIARAVATQETWSGVTVSWPVDDGGERLSVELSGLPVFDRDRTFRGYRGFGVCRDLERINHLLRARRERTIGLAPQPQAPRETEASLAEAQPRTERPALNVVPAAANVVPFRQGMAVEPNAPTLSPIERKAFRELAQELTARLRSAREDTASDNGLSQLHIELQAGATELVEARPVAPGSEPVSGGGLLSERSDAAHPHAAPAFEPALLDRIPLGVLIYRHDGPHDALLYANRYFLELSGHESLGALAATGLDNLFAEPGADAFSQTAGAQSLSILTRDGARRLVEGRLFTIPWGGASALALILTNGEAEERRRANAELLAAQNEIRDLKVHVESFKKAEADLLAATREAQKAAASKAEFVAKVSHEIRTPLNAITGFAEVIMAERFGPIGNERYAEYLKDIHGAGLHLVSLLNDLLDLSKIETGQLDLSFANISLNDLTQQCVGIMQPQASRARIIIRTSLMPGLPQVVADERSLRQIVLNLLSNSIRFTGPGGQVIVSTAFADSGEAVLRVRDTGVGMSEKDVEAALEPFRQTATAGSWGSGGTGLGLPLTKALAEANRAHFSIKTAPNAGTLIEVAFPPTRVVAH